MVATDLRRDLLAGSRIYARAAQVAALTALMAKEAQAAAQASPTAGAEGDRSAFYITGMLDAECGVEEAGNTGTSHGCQMLNIVLEVPERLHRVRGPSPSC